MHKRLILSLLIALTAAAGLAAEADLIVPVTGTIPGALGSHWQGELTLHSAATEAVVVDVTLHRSAGEPVTTSVALAAGATQSFSNVALDLFGLEQAIGALTIDVPDSAEGRIVATSRVANHTETGLLGQDVPAVRATETLRSGATGVIAGPKDTVRARFNFGIFAVDASAIEWRLVRADGTVAATKELSYDAGTAIQYAPGVEGLFAVTRQSDDVVYARVLEGNAVVYGSAIDNGTGDPTFVPGFEVREGFAIELLGVDKDGDGAADFFDADRDGVLDQAVPVGVGPFPDGFRILVHPGETGSVTLTVIEAPYDADFIDANGMVSIFPPLGASGSATIVVRATDGFRTTDLTIPVVFN
ncbi:MAG: hypothetical protein ACRD2J_12195 [Thermoanaerobaculia bacterium]